jgi:perosamine synthetase
MAFSLEQRPAILGGLAIRTAGPPNWPRIDQPLRNVFEQLSTSGEWGRYHGPHGPALIRRIAEYHGVDHVLLCSSGTAAIELALRGLGVVPGDEVILAGYDFKANFQNILCVGATPVLVDIQPQTWQMNPDKLSAAISTRTRALIVSHLHGGVVPVPEIRKFAAEHGIAMIEDACQNPGAILYGRRAGTSGDVGVLSFGGSKLLTAGRGGALLTNRTDVTERIKRYVQRGNEAYPLSEFQSAILAPQIEQLEVLNWRRSDAVEQLARRLEGIPGLKFLQRPTPDIQPAYYKVGLQYHCDEFAGLPRDLFAEALRAEGIAIDPGFRSLHRIHASRRFRAADELIEATRADGAMLTLHHPVLLEGELAITEIVHAIQKIRDHAQEITETLKESKTNPLDGSVLP